MADGVATMLWHASPGQLYYYIYLHKSIAHFQTFRARLIVCHGHFQLHLLMNKGTDDSPIHSLSVVRVKDGPRASVRPLVSSLSEKPPAPATVPTPPPGAASFGIGLP